MCIRDRPRILKNLALFPLESVLLILFLMVMIPLAYRMHLVYDAGDQLHLKKRQAILLGVLFLFAAGCVAGYFVYDYNNNDPDAARRNMVQTTALPYARVFIVAPSVPAQVLDTPVDARAIAPTVAGILRIRSPNAAGSAPLRLKK